MHISRDAEPLDSDLDREYWLTANGGVGCASPMVLLAAFDLHGPVELLEEDDSGEGVG